jgi:hypothetical protein
MEKKENEETNDFDSYACALWILEQCSIRTISNFRSTT